MISSDTKKTNFHEFRKPVVTNSQSVDESDVYTCRLLV